MSYDIAFVFTPFLINRNTVCHPRECGDPGSGILFFMYYVYIMASKKNGTIYIGVTSDLKRRVYEHKEKIHKGITEKYDVTMLVWYETTVDVESAITREKQLKKWKREWKLELIEKMNYGWADLYSEL